MLSVKLLQTCERPLDTSVVSRLHIGLVPAHPTVHIWHLQNFKGLAKSSALCCVPQPTPAQLSLAPFLHI